jgi:nucleoside-diphosphate-sugar epimerase
MSITPSNGQVVLVTGINGYIASCLGLELLKQGYTLRGTARRASSTDILKQGAYQPYAERFTAYDVPDMTVPGAFDEAVKGTVRFHDYKRGIVGH